jgi:hypothetical protein
LLYHEGQQVLLDQQVLKDRQVKRELLAQQVLKARQEPPVLQALTVKAYLPEALLIRYLQKPAALITTRNGLMLLVVVQVVLTSTVKPRWHLHLMTS